MTREQFWLSLDRSQHEEAVKSIVEAVSASALILFARYAQTGVLSEAEARMEYKEHMLEIARHIGVEVDLT